MGQPSVTDAGSVSTTGSTVTATALSEAEHLFFMSQPLENIDALKLIQSSCLYAWGCALAV